MSKKVWVKVLWQYPAQLRGPVTGQDYKTVQPGQLLEIEADDLPRLINKAVARAPKSELDAHLAATQAPTTKPKSAPKGDK